MPGMHLTMWLVVVYCQSFPHYSLISFPAIGLDEVELWAAKAGRRINQKGSKYALEVLRISPSVHHAVFSGVRCGTPLLLIFGQFPEGAREGGNESPFKKCPKTTRKPQRIPTDAVARWQYFER